MFRCTGSDVAQQADRTVSEQGDDPGLQHLCSPAGGDRVAAQWPSADQVRLQVRHRSVSQRVGELRHPQPPHQEPGEDRLRQVPVCRQQLPGRGPGGDDIVW